MLEFRFFFKSAVTCCLLCVLLCWGFGPHQSDEGCEDHAHANHHPLFRGTSWSDLKVVFRKEALHQSIL